MDLSKLVEALEAAAEGSEYLDYAIQRHFTLTKPVPAYTSSVDAAMSLLPEGWSIHRLCHRHDCRGNFTGWFAELYRASDAVIQQPANSLGATAALALCVAAMRVRHSELAPAETGATVTGVVTSAAYSMTNTPGPPASISATSGGGQTTAVNTSFPTQVVATVKDAGANPVAKPELG